MGPGTWNSDGIEDDILVVFPLRQLLGHGAWVWI